MRDDPAVRAPWPLILVAFAGAACALVGGYWDDAWHTERGRDGFFIAPHIAIYAGIAATGAALVIWALVVLRRRGPGALWSHKPLVLALLSVGVTLASGPIDNFWHLAFGRDSVIWSPPHMLGIAGTLTLGAALMVELASRSENWAQRMRSAAGALVLAAAGFTVAEYDTDVPQFDVVWYLPALGLAGAIGLSLVRASSTWAWAATRSALLYLAFVAAVGGVLALLDFPPPALPLLILPAVVVDLAKRQRWPAPLTAAAFAIVLFASYVPARNWLGEGVRFDLADVAVGMPLTFVAGWAVFAVASGKGIPRLRPSPAVVNVLLIFLAVAPSAMAHDPGQGDDAGTSDSTLTLDGSTATLNAELSRGCNETEPKAIVARRGGETVSSSLTEEGCLFTGSVELPERGRWFVYAEMLRDGDAIETWLPISVGTGPQTVHERARYVYYPPEGSSGALKVGGGIVLYAGMLALLYGAFTLVRASARDSPHRIGLEHK